MPLRLPLTRRSPADELFAEYLAPMRGRLRAGIVVAVLGGAMALAIPQALRWLVDTVLAPGATPARVWESAGVIAVLGLAQVLFQWLRRRLLLEPSTRLEMDMRERLFDHLLRLPVGFHDRWPSGQLLSRSMSDLGLCRRWVAFGISQTGQTSTMVVFGLLLMVANSWQLALIYLIAVGPVLWVIVRTLPRTRELTRATQQQAGDLATGVEESVHGIRVLKALGRGEHALGEFSEKAAGLRDTEVTRSRVFSGLSARIWLIPEIVMAACLLIAGFLVAAGALSTGAVVAFFATAVLVSTRLRDAGMLLNMYQSALVARERHQQIIAQTGTEAVPITGATHPVRPRGAGAGSVGAGSPGDEPSGAESAGAESSGAAVSLEGVGFSYPDEAGAEAPVLRGVDLRLRPGETVALVGATGSGKSTLLMLLPRLYEADAGRILLDGRNAAELSLDELRGQIAVAFEEPTLFSASVRQNVLMGVPDVVGPDGQPVPDELLDADQTARREQILTTALRAAAAEFAWELPDGVDTQIGEEGLSLSGGQRQRLALARAIAADPRLMLLDDPLSALDTRTEAAVVDNLRRVLTGTTTLLTAHRPSTVALADRVTLLRDGRIAAVGTHRELLALPEYRYVMSAEEATRG